MPNNKQQAKRLKTDNERRDRNKIVKSSMRSSVRKVLEAETKDDALAKTPEAMKRIDKAAKNNVIHDNTAARMKSRLARSTASK